MKKVLITGATGFIGKALLKELKDYDVFTIGRTKPNSIDREKFLEAEINSTEKYESILKDIDIVIHLAAKVHDPKSKSLESYWETNTLGTLNLVKQCELMKVKRFIYLSSIKVNGECTPPGKPFCRKDQANPQDAYSLSKHEAELAILKTCSDTMEFVIIRPPLVYGPNAKANFEKLWKLVNLGLPLPFGSINNKRAFIAIDNLVSFIIHCVESKNAANEIFLVSDNFDICLTHLVQEMKRSLGLPLRLIAIPEKYLTYILKIIGKKEMAKKMFSALEIDVQETHEILNWSPEISMKDQFQKMKSKNKIIY